MKMALNQRNGGQVSPNRRNSFMKTKAKIRNKLAVNILRKELKKYRDNYFAEKAFCGSNITKFERYISELEDAIKILKHSPAATKN